MLNIRDYALGLVRFHEIKKGESITLWDGANLKMIDRDFENHYFLSLSKKGEMTEWYIFDGRHCEWVHEWSKEKLVQAWMKMKSTRTEEQVKKLNAWKDWKEKKKNAFIRERDKNVKYKTPEWVHESWDRSRFVAMHGTRGW